MKEKEFDKNHLWHPFTQALTADDPLCIVKGKGPFLFDEKGKKYIDLISSWWVTCHGHAHPKLAKAIYKQAQTLEQVIFAGFTHLPAIHLGQKLLKYLPKDLTRFFFSDNGSTAIEVALKMAYQYFYNQNQKEKKIFLHFEGGYHGDTFGAMAVGRSSDYYKPFEDLFFETFAVPFPETWDGDENVEEKEAHSLRVLENYLIHNKNKVVAFIMEVQIQGACGMKIGRALFYKKLHALLRAHNILIIYDEVMTGFYRTGTFFSFDKIGLSPDFLCLSKALSGGCLPLSLTITSEKIFEAFLNPSINKAFLHGHSFTANPLGCAAAIASLEIFEQKNYSSKITNLEITHKKKMLELLKTGLIHKTAVIGTISRFELKNSSAEKLTLLKKQAQEKGLILRPLKGVIYLMPPYVISKKDLSFSYDILKELIKNLA
jgi:adenosylmethionine-8-amino-7-oxononanoate aminotransferase